MDNQYNYNTPNDQFQNQATGMEDRIFISDRQIQIFSQKKEKKPRDHKKAAKIAIEGSALQLHLA